MYLVAQYLYPFYIPLKLSWRSSLIGLKCKTFNLVDASSNLVYVTKKLGVVLPHGEAASLVAKSGLHRGEYITCGGEAVTRPLSTE